MNFIITLSPWHYPSSSDKESACNAGDPGLIPGLGRSPGEADGYPLQYSFLGNPMDREPWQATVHGLQRVGHGWVTNTFSSWHHHVHSINEGSKSQDTNNSPKNIQVSSARGEV